MSIEKLACLLPPLDTDNKEYWAGMRRHELLLQDCPRCHKLTFPFQPVCPHCHSLETGWRKSSGKGKIYSWVIVRRGSNPLVMDMVPYAVVLVEMEEGARVLGFIDCPIEQLREGLSVEAGFVDLNEEFSLLKFRVV